jgi:hypothetical protein
MLINLSNHPSEKWGIEQTNAVFQQYGHVEDLAFPAIDPYAEEDEILELAEDFLLQCMELFADFEHHNPQSQGQHAVHIQGEFTFVYALVRMLERKGISCVASTTLRVAHVDENGNKTSVFKFIQFRAYKSVNEITN